MATATKARRSTKAAKVEEPDEDEDSGGLREPTELHELMAEYFNDNYDAGVTPLQCAIFTSKRTEFRKSDMYLEYRDELKVGRANKAAEKAKRAAAREADADDEDEAPKRSRRRKAAPAEEAAEEAPSKTTRARRGRPAKATETDEPPAKAAPRSRRRTGAAATEATEAKAAPARSRRRRGAVAADTEAEVF